MDNLYGMKVIVREWVPPGEIWIGPEKGVEDMDRLKKVCDELVAMRCLCDEVERLRGWTRKAKS